MYRLAHRLHIGLDMLWRIGSVLFVSGIPKHVPCFLFFLRNAISHFAINLLENKKQIFHIGISATNLSHIRVRKPFLPSCFRSPESLFRYPYPLTLEHGLNYLQSVRLASHKPIPKEASYNLSTINFTDYSPNTAL